MFELPADAVIQNGLTRFYGVDWLATISGLTGVYLIGSKKRFGFLVMMAASLSWMTVGFLVQSFALIIGSTVFFSLHLRGWLKWRSGLEEAGKIGSYETTDIPG